MGKASEGKVSSESSTVANPLVYNVAETTAASYGKMEGDTLNG